MNLRSINYTRLTLADREALERSAAENCRSLSAEIRLAVRQYLASKNGRAVSEERAEYSTQ
jgi:hypothetical protein